MKVCALQMESKPDKAFNLSQAELLINEAVIKTSPQLVVLPEMFSYYGGTAQQRLENAESILPLADRPRTTFDFLQRLAKKHSIFGCRPEFECYPFFRLCFFSMSLSLSLSLLFTHPQHTHTHNTHTYTTHIHTGTTTRTARLVRTLLQKRRDETT